MTATRRPPEERFKGRDDNWLFARRHEVIDRMERNGKAGATNGFIQWARERDGGLKHVGTSVDNKTGREIGRLRDDCRIVEEVDKELSDRGYSVEEIAEEYERHCEQVEREAMAAQSGDVSFNITETGDVAVPVPTRAEPTTTAPVVTTRQAKPAKRDRLWWVAFLREYTETHKRGKP